VLWDEFVAFPLCEIEHLVVGYAPLQLHYICVCIATWSPGRLISKSRFTEMGDLLNLLAARLTFIIAEFRGCAAEAKSTVTKCQLNSPGDSEEG
jgi:hypothetical protein